MGSHFLLSRFVDGKSNELIDGLVIEHYKVSAGIIFKLFLGKSLFDRY